MATSSASPAVIILAAGKGTRMKSALPKVMHRVAGLPMIAHVAATAAALRPSQMTVVIAPGMEPVQEVALKAYNSCQFAVQKQQRGTGDAVRAAMPLLKNHAGPVLILYGDTPLMRSETLARLLQGFDDPGVALAVLAMTPHDAAQYGRVVLGQRGEVERIVEFRDAGAAERKIGLCNSGVMAVRGTALRTLLPQLSDRNANHEFYLTDLVALARAGKQRVLCVRTEAEEVMGVNSRAELAMAEHNLQQRLRARAMEGGVTLINPESVYLAADTKLAADVVIHPQVVFGAGVSVAADTEIRSFCHIEGARIGAGCTIGPFARLRPGTVLAEGVHVGNFVELKKTTAAKGAKINHLSYVGDARVGARANIGAGTITCNYDGFGKYETVIGDEAFIGSDTALVAPVKIGKRAIIGAGSVITKDVAADAIAVTRAEQVEKSGGAKKFREKRMAKKGKR